jgi:hypothetical protein
MNRKKNDDDDFISYYYVYKIMIISALFPTYITCILHFSSKKANKFFFLLN